MSLTCCLPGNLALAMRLETVSLATNQRTGLFYTCADIADLKQHNAATAYYLYINVHTAFA